MDLRLFTPVGSCYSHQPCTTWIAITPVLSILVCLPWTLRRAGANSLASVSPLILSSPYACPSSITDSLRALTGIALMLNSRRGASSKE